MRSFWGFIPHHHTGRVAPHDHTSYPALVFLLLLMAVVLAAISRQSMAAPEDEYVIPPPETRGFSVWGTVNAPPPSKAPTLEGVSEGQTISQAPVEVFGTCPSNTLVKVFKNEILAGATLCDRSGRYRLPIDFFIGPNRLVARAYNTLEKVSPDSNAINVIFAPPGATGLTTGSAPQLKPDGTPAGQFFIKAEVFHRGFRPGKETSWPLSIIGGKAPYAVSVAWGDKKTDVYARGASGPFDIKHKYENAGGYRGQQDIVIKASDSTGATTYLQVVALVNDATVTELVKTMPSGLQLAWPLLILAVMMVLSFLLGEWREKKIIKKKLAVGAA